MSKIRIFSPQRARIVGSKVHPAAFWEYIAAYGFGDRICNIDALVDDDTSWYMLMRLSSPRHVHPDLANSIGATCVFDELTPAELQLLILGNGFLLLDMGIEAFFAHDPYFDALHSAAALYGIKASNIIIMNNNLRSAQYYGLYCDNNSIHDRITFVGVNVGPWLYVARCCFTDKMQTNPGKGKASNLEIYIKERTRRFVSFNGRDRPHRFYLLSWMFTKGFLSDSWISFLAYDARRKSSKGELDGNDRDNYVKELQKRYSTFPFAEQVVSHIGGFLDIIPLQLDIGLKETSDLKLYEQNIYDDQPDEYYNDAYFSIVTDTAFFDRTLLFITEKIFKSISRLSPYIFIGSSGSLRWLHDIGMESFAPFIDESYDELGTDMERFRACLSEIERLATLSDEEARKLFNSVWPVVVHNYQHLHSGLPTVFARRIEKTVLDPLASGEFAHPSTLSKGEA